MLIFSVYCGERGTEQNFVDIYIKKGYKICLGEIVYKFDEHIDKQNKFGKYTELYGKVAEQMNYLLEKYDRKGGGTGCGIENVAEIVNNAPQNFSVVGQLLTYQSIVEANSGKFNDKVLKFYKLY